MNLRPICQVFLALYLVRIIEANQRFLNGDSVSTMSAGNKDELLHDTVPSDHTEPSSNECTDIKSENRICSELKENHVVEVSLPASITESVESFTNAKNVKENVEKEPRVVAQEIGIADNRQHEDKESFQQHREKGSDDELWTEMTEEPQNTVIEHKRSGQQNFFSLMNLLKFLLNPVIEEFQEVEKSPNGSKVNTKPAQNVNTSGILEKDNNKNASDSSKKTKFQCLGRNMTENVTSVVRVVNSTELLDVLSFERNHTHSDCVLVMFYAPWCHFCAATAPHYNALGRAFPQLDVLAVDTVHFSNLNARFGTVAVPNIMLFHQSRSAVRFNHTERNFENLVQFIQNTTGLEPNVSVEMTKEDFEGPLSSIPTEETDYLLWFAWLFAIICGGHLFIQSSSGQHVIEKVRILWQEHQHIE